MPKVGRALRANKSVSKPGVCPLCEKPVVVGTIHIDALGRRWHGFCADKVGGR